MRKHIRAHRAAFHRGVSVVLMDEAYRLPKLHQFTRSPLRIQLGLLPDTLTFRDDDTLAQICTAF